MQPESNEEREAWNVRHVRRLLGLPDTSSDPRVDALIREALGHYQYYDHCVDYVKRRMRIGDARTGKAGVR